MDQRLKLSIWVAISGLVLTFVFPPWIEKANVPRRVHFEKSLGYGVVWQEPSSSLVNDNDDRDVANKTSITVDYSRLFTEWVLIGLTFAAVIATRRPVKHAQTGATSPAGDRRVSSHAVPGQGIETGAVEKAGPIGTNEGTNPSNQSGSAHPVKSDEPEERVKVISPDGKPGTIPRSQLATALTQGYRKAADAGAN